MRHPDEGTIHAFLDGELTAEEARTLEAHVETCRSCAEHLRAARAVFEESNTLVERVQMPARAPVPPSAAAPAPAPVTPGRPPSTWAAPSHRLRTLAWAATVVMAAGVGFVANEWRHRLPGDAAPSVATETPAPVAEGDVERFGDLRGVASGETAPEAQPARDLGQTVGDGAGVGARGERVGARRRATESAPTEALGAPPAAPAAAPLDQLAANTELRDAVAQDAAAVAANEVAGRAAQAGEEVSRAEREAAARAREGESAKAAPSLESRVDARAEAQNRAAPAAELVPNAPVSADGRVENARRQLAEQGGGAGGFMADAPAKSRGAVTSIGLEQAVDLLNGAIRLMEGASPERIEATGAPSVPWAAVRSPMVRVVYRIDTSEVVVSQMLLDREPRPLEQAEADAVVPSGADAYQVPELAAGDTLFSAGPAGRPAVWWLDGPGRLMSLSGGIGGSLSQGDLLGLLRRIR